jgi:Pyruvate/2-oxoacid:ferredoxin oxidoreductase delta subunit
VAKPKPVVHHALCRPAECGGGTCVALAACTAHILQQDGPGEPPYPVVDCKGCRKCAAACPLSAIKMI